MQETKDATTSYAQPAFPAMYRVCSFQGRHNGTFSASKGVIETETERHTERERGGRGREREKFAKSFQVNSLTIKMQSVLRLRRKQRGDPFQEYATALPLGANPKRIDEETKLLLCIYLGKRSEKEKEREKPSYTGRGGLRSRSKMLSFMTRENLRDQIVYLFTVKEFNCPRNDRKEEIAD